MMQSLIECVGDPRAMGSCQGLACRDEIQERIRRAGLRAGRSRLPSLRALTSGSVLGGGVGREMIRHYTHLAERTAGMARHADVPLAALMGLFCAATRDSVPQDLDEGKEVLAPAVVVGALRGGAGNGRGVLARSLENAEPAGSSWLIRKSRPEVGFASAELTLPWLATSVAGVNSAGVAVAIAPRIPADPSGGPRMILNPRHSPHPVLLVQECLQRFEDVAGCLDWCRKRPSHGTASLVFSDALGGLVAVEFDGSDCRVVETRDDIVIEGAPPDVAKGMREQVLTGSFESKRFFSALPAPSIDRVVWLDAAERTLTLGSAEGPGDSDLCIEAPG